MPSMGTDQIPSTPKKAIDGMRGKSTAEVRDVSGSDLIDGLEQLAQP